MLCSQVGLILESTLEFDLYLEPTDMRISFDILCGIENSELHSKPTKGTAYLFVNRLRSKIKILSW